MKNALFYYLLEIRFRLCYIIGSVILTFLVAYSFSFELIYLFVRPFFAPKNFIFTDLTEALSITLKICILFTLNLVLPLVIYEFWCFVIPSFLKSERKRFNFFVYIVCLLFFFAIFFIYFFLLPEIFHFLFAFEIKKDILTIQLEARIHSYVQFTLYIYILFLFFFQVPLFFKLLFTLKIISPWDLSFFRKFIFFFSLLIGALLSPPDIYSQLCLAFFFFIIYELSIWLGFLEVAKLKK